MENEMIHESNTIEDYKPETKEKVKNWIKTPYNFAFILIFIFAIIIRLYYFFLTKGQALWWDEADYMAFAKTLAGVSSTHWIVTGPHSSLFSYLAAFLFKIGFSDSIVRFTLEIIPSALLVLITYKICTLLYKDKRIALISSFLIAVFWDALFYSMRFQLESLSLFIGFLSIYIFSQGYIKKQKIFGKININYTIPITVLLVVLTYSLRRGYFTFGVFFLLYLVLTKKPKELFKDKYNWLGLMIFLVTFFLAEKFIFVAPIAEAIQPYAIRSTQLFFNLIPFDVFKAFFLDLNYNYYISVLFWLFYIGFFLLIYKLLITMGHYKEGSEELKSDLLMFITIFVTLSYFLFFQKRIDEFGEPRWYYPLLLGSLICISKGGLLISDYIKKYNKQFSTIVLIILIGFGGYYELKHADFIIKIKVSSYEGTKQAGLFLKELVKPNEAIYSVPTPQIAYYSERNVTSFVLLLGARNNEFVNYTDGMDSLRKNKDIKYLVVSFEEPNHPIWMKKEEYIQDPATGQVIISKWEIPLMDTVINFQTGEQKIEKIKDYGDIKFELIGIFKGVFVYRITRT